MITRTINGLPGAAAQLGAAADDLARRLSQALQQGADIVAEEARRNVARNRDPQRPLPSTLADRIAVVPEASGADVVAAAPHAPFVEFGTRRMPAEPFLHPAFLASRDRVLALARRVVAGEAR